MQLHPIKYHVDCLNSNVYTIVGRGFGEQIASCLLMSTLCLNLQKLHKNFQQMFQNCSTMEIDIPTNVQTMLKLCLIIMCQQNQLGLGHLSSNGGAIE